MSDIGIKVQTVLCLHNEPFEFEDRTDMRKKDTRLYADRFPNGCSMARTLFVEPCVYHGLNMINQKDAAGCGHRVFFKEDAHQELSIKEMRSSQ